MYAESTSPSMSFGEFRGRWLDQINADLELKGAAFQVGYNIMRFVNRKTGTTFVGNAKLADAAHVTERTVRTVLHFLRDRGHLQIEQPSANARLVLRPMLQDSTRKPFPPHQEEFSSERAETISSSGGNSFRASSKESATCDPNSRFLTFKPNSRPPAVVIAPQSEEWRAWFTHYATSGNVRGYNKMDDLAKKNQNYLAPSRWPPSSVPKAA